MTATRSIDLSRFIPALLLAASACTCGGPPVEEESCPAIHGTTSAGTVHGGAITSDETWAAAGSPHIVEQPLSVTGEAVLTIEPCAVVRVAPGVRIEVGEPVGTAPGRVVARGTAEAPIVVERSSAEAWAAFVVHAPSVLELAHVTLTGGGADDFVGGATLVGLGGGTTPAAELIFVDTVTVSGSRGHGVYLDRAARFADGSQQLIITGSGDDARAEPLVTGLHGLTGLPGGTYTGNARDEILILEDEANASPGLQVDAVLHDLGVPYRVGLFPGDDLRVGASGGAPVTLTIEAGVTMRFQPDGQLRVVSDADVPRGRLLVHGTAAQPVTFTSLNDDDGAGAWAGLYFEGPGEGVMADHDIAFARIVNAGGDCSCALTSCSPVTTSNAAVVLDGTPAAAFVHDSTIVASAGHGFVRSWLDRRELDFLASNTADDVAECPQTMPQLSDEVCPDARYACQQ